MKSGWDERSGWAPSLRYPDPLVKSLDKRFDKYRLPLASVERLYTGARWSEGPVWFGDGGHPELISAMRRHGNLAENAAIFIAGFTLLEIMGGNRTALIIMCAAFVLARISHAVGLSLKKTSNPFRTGGVAVTVIVGIALGARLMLTALPHLGL